MGSLVVVGAQWGDEGKGRIVDLLSEAADVVVRFQGGAIGASCSFRQFGRRHTTR